MGQPPIIQDDATTVNLPADVDEEQFGPLTTELPAPSECSKNFSYFTLKCRYGVVISSPTPFSAVK